MDNLLTTKPPLNKEYQLNEKSSVISLTSNIVSKEIIIYHRYHRNQLFNVSPRVGTSRSLVMTQNTTVMEGQRVVLICRTPNNKPDVTFHWIKRVSGLSNVIDVVNEMFN